MLYTPPVPYVLSEPYYAAEVLYTAAPKSTCSVIPFVLSYPVLLSYVTCFCIPSLPSSLPFQYLSFPILHLPYSPFSLCCHCPVITLYIAVRIIPLFHTRSLPYTAVVVHSPCPNVSLIYTVPAMYFLCCVLFLVLLDTCPSLFSAYPVIFPDCTVPSSLL